MRELPYRKWRGTSYFYYVVALSRLYRTYRVGVRGPRHAGRNTVFRNSIIRYYRRPYGRSRWTLPYSLETLLTLFRQKNGRVLYQLFYRCYGLRRRRAINNARKATRSMRVTTGCAGACGDACTGDAGSVWVRVLPALVALAALPAPTASLAAAPAATLDARWAARASLLSTSTRGICGGRDAPSGCAVPDGQVIDHRAGYRCFYCRSMTANHKSGVAMRAHARG